MTEYEIGRGMPDRDDCTKHCVGIIRTISDLEKQLHMTDVGKFIDLRPDSTVDHEAQTLLRSLREDKLPLMFQASDNLFNMMVQWQTTGDCSVRGQPATAAESPIHGQKDYLNQLCAVLYQKLSLLITSAIWEIENLVGPIHLAFIVLICVLFVFFVYVFLTSALVIVITVLYTLMFPCSTPVWFG